MAEQNHLISMGWILDSKRVAYGSPSRISDVDDLLPMLSVDLACTKTFRHLPHDFDMSLSLNLEYTMRTRTVASTEEIECKSGIALQIESAGPAVALGLVRKFPHMFSVGSAMSKHLNGVRMSVGVRWYTLARRDDVCAIHQNLLLGQCKKHVMTVGFIGEVLLGSTV